MQLTISKKLILGFGIVLCLMTISAGVTYFNLTNVRQIQGTVLETRFPTALMGTQLVNGLNKSLAALRGYILLGKDPQKGEAFKQARADAWQEMDKSSSSLQEKSKEWTVQANRERLTFVVAELEPFRQAQQEIEQVAHSRGNEGMKQAMDWLGTRAAPRAAAIEAKLMEMIQSQEELLAGDKASLDGQISTLAYTVVIAAVFGICIGIFVSVWIGRSVTHGIGRVVDCIREAQRDNDLTKRADAASKDEMGELGRSYNACMENLDHTISRVAENTGTLASASQEFASVSQQMGSNAEETSAQATVVSAAAEQVSKNLQTVSTATEEMMASVKEIAKNANEAAKVATAAVKVAESTNTTVAKLGESSEEIGQVIKVITSIAQQTNLLALNATIEAARAGEAGKGFAVVANEVKELAKETAKATEEIGQKIQTIQNDSKGAVEAIAQIASIINQINDISTTIASSVEEQAATTTDITQNVTEAAKGSEEIAKNIAGVAQAAQNTTVGASQAQQASTELAHMAAELKRLVENFKVSGNGRVRADSVIREVPGAPAPSQEPPVLARAA